MTPNDPSVMASSTPVAEGAAAITLAGRVLIADASGGLFEPESRTLVVSDLHLEKGAALARRGALAPPYDTAATLRRLARLMAAREPRRVVALGDSFHDAAGPEAVGAAEAETLARLVEGVEWIWIAGNHDPEPTARFGGVAAGEVRLAGLALRHEPTREGGEGEIAGHLHPVAKVRVRGRTFRRRCFAADGRRLVMPAFGAFTGGLNVRDAAFADLFGAFEAWLLGEGRLHRFDARALSPD